MLQTLNAELEVASLGRARTQLAISGRYDPPLCIFGQTVDRLRQHRVAEVNIFFFPSRRRHTSFSRDWSSDVCSSDLGSPRKRQIGVLARALARLASSAE